MLDELCAEGALELCERLSSGEYDEERGKLTIYLHPFLRGKMYRYLEANVGAIALPKDEMQRIKQAQRLHKEEKLPLDEVAQSLNVSAEKAKPAPQFKRMTAWDIRQFAGFPFFAGFSKIITENQRKRRLLSWHFLSTAR